MIAIIIMVFTVTRTQKMVNREDPNVYEIGRGLDLVSNDAAEYDLRANNYTIGVGSYIRKYNTEGFTDENFDLSLFFSIGPV
jgi:hypothetical protein